MTLQTTKAISLSNIQTEFGGSSPISMSEYYRGGAVYAAGNITAYSDERLKTNWRSLGEGFIFSAKEVVALRAEIEALKARG